MSGSYAFLLKLYYPYFNVLITMENCDMTVTLKVEIYSATQVILY